ncbi:IS5/IS1182 family transposase, partial [Pseudoalteromonas citrea]
MKKKIRNWSQYNRALVQRGNINIWLSESAISKWQNTEKHGG